MGPSPGTAGPSWLSDPHTGRPRPRPRRGPETGTLAPPRDQCAQSPWAHTPSWHGAGGTPRPGALNPRGPPRAPAYLGAARGAGPGPSFKGQATQPGSRPRPHPLPLGGQAPTACLIRAARCSGLPGSIPASAAPAQASSPTLHRASPRIPVIKEARAQLIQARPAAAARPLGWPVGPHKPQVHLSPGWLPLPSARPRLPQEALPDHLPVATLSPEHSPT